MLTRAFKAYFSSIKIPVESIKRLREQTSAPMAECRTALQESQCDHEGAVQWLKQKGLITADKRSSKQTRQGVIAAYVTPCRTKALLLEVNCETDFVAKNDIFLRFVDGLGNKFLSNEAGVNIEGVATETKAKFQQILETTQPSHVFPDGTEVKNMSEELKLVISRLQENIRIRRAVTFHTDFCRYGAYVHRPYTKGVGLQACIVQLSSEHEIQDEDAIETVNQFADDMATQILGSPPKYLNYQEIPEELIAQQAQKVKTEVASVLAKAPQHMHEKIISGKLLSNFYSQTLLGCMPYVLSNEGSQVSEYWSDVQSQVGTGISIHKYVTWECQ